MVPYSLQCAFTFTLSGKGSWSMVYTWVAAQVPRAQGHIKYGSQGAGTPPPPGNLHGHWPTAGAQNPPWRHPFFALIPSFALTAKLSLESIQPIL